MKNLSTVLVLASCFMFAACTPSELVSQEKQTFTIVKVKPPKRLYVDLKDSNGVVHHEYVSKRCGSWKKIKVNSQVQLTVNTYKRGNETYQKIDVSHICPK